MNNHTEFCNEKHLPRIYVACLAAYNNGYLHGAWIDANQDIYSLNAEIKQMLESSPIPNAEEFAIHDYMGFGRLTIDEYESLDRVSELANYLTESTELEQAVLAHTNGHIEDARRLLDECYQGAYASEENFAESYAQDCMEIPAHLEYYIDYERLAKDLFINDYFSMRVNNITHVFCYF